MAFLVMETELYKTIVNTDLLQIYVPSYKDAQAAFPESLLVLILP